MITFAAVRKIGLRLPDVEAGTMHGAPALKVHGKLLACIAVHKSAEPNTLAVRIDFEPRTQLVADDPRTYYLTPHYVDYPVVLVRLSHVHADALRDLLGGAWRFVSSEKTAKRKRTASGARRKGARART